MVRHSDRHIILTAYSRQTGRISLLLPAANTPRAAAMRSLAMPMGRFDCIVQLRPGRDIFNLSDMRRRGPLPSASPVKSALSMFAADVVASLLREPQPDRNLFDYLEQWSEQLVAATPQATANMHIAFLITLMHFMGIEPDWTTYTDGAVFDMAGGIFRTSSPYNNHFLPSDEARVAYSMRRMNLRTASHFILTRNDRNRILDILLQYYHIHFPSLGTLNSLPVLRTLFDF